MKLFQFILFGILIVFCYENIFGQNDTSPKIEESVLGSLIESECEVSNGICDKSENVIKCPKVESLETYFSEQRKNDLEIIKKITDDVKKMFEIDYPLGIAIAKDLKGAFAIQKCKCLKEYEDKPIILIGEKLIGFDSFPAGNFNLLNFGISVAPNEVSELPVNNNDRYIEEFKSSYILAGVIAHEIAHFKQRDLEMMLSGKEIELHADFLAGWYLQNQTIIIIKRDFNSDSKKQIKKQAILAGLSKFFDLGDDKIDRSDHHGYSEDRLQMVLNGIRVSGKPFRIVYEEGISIINNNPLFWNHPNSEGRSFRQQLDNIKHQKYNDESTFIFHGIECKVQLNRNSKEINWEITNDENNSKAKFKEIIRDIWSAMPKFSKRIVTGKNRVFMNAPENIDFPVKSVFILNDNTKIKLKISVEISENEFPKIENQTELDDLGLQLAPQIEEVSMANAENERFPSPKFSINKTECQVTPIKGNNGSKSVHKVSCNFVSDKPQNEFFNKLKMGINSWLSVDSKITSKNDWRYADDNKNYFLAVNKENDSQAKYFLLENNISNKSISLVIQTKSGFKFEEEVKEVRIINEIGKKIENKLQSLSESANLSKNEKFDLFENSDCSIEERDVFLRTFECSIKPNKLIGKTTQKLFENIEKGFMSCSPIGWKEEYNLTSYYGEMSLNNNTNILKNIDLFINSDDRVTIQGTIFSTNKKIMFGVKTPSPNSLGLEINQLIDQIINNKDSENEEDNENKEASKKPKFSLRDHECLINSGQSDEPVTITCKFDANEQNFMKIREGIVSTLSDSWRYSLLVNEFSANKPLFDYKNCDDEAQKQNEYGKIECFLKSYSMRFEKNALNLIIEINLPIEILPDEKL